MSNVAGVNSSGFAGAETAMEANSPREVCYRGEIIASDQASRRLSDRHFERSESVDVPLACFTENIFVLAIADDERALAVPLGLDELEPVAGWIDRDE